MAAGSRSRVRHLAGAALAALLVLQAAGCAVFGHRGPAGEDARREIARFMTATIAGESDRAFAWIEVETLANNGQPVGALYRSLSPQHQQQYRRDFVGGIYAFLFRDLPPEQARYQVAVPDPARPVVEVTGRPGKGLRLTVAQTPGGLRIVAIEKMGRTGP
jgi:hypothetical protein